MLAMAGRRGGGAWERAEVSWTWRGPSSLWIPRPLTMPAARAAMLDGSEAADRRLSAYLLPLLAAAVELCTTAVERQFPSRHHFRRDFARLRACFDGAHPYAVRLTARAAVGTAHALEVTRLSIDTAARVVHVAIAVDAREIPPPENTTRHPMALWRVLRPGHLLYLLWAAVHCSPDSPERALDLKDLTAPPERSSFTANGLLEILGRMGASTIERTHPSPVAALQAALREQRIPERLEIVMSAAGYSAADVRTVEAEIRAQPIDFYLELEPAAGPHPHGDLAAGLVTVHRVGTKRDRLRLHWIVAASLAGSLEEAHLLLLVARGLLLHRLRGEREIALDAWPERHIDNINRTNCAGAFRLAELRADGRTTAGTWSTPWLAGVERWWQLFQTVAALQRTRSHSLPDTTGAALLLEAILALPKPERAAFGIPAAFLNPTALAPLEPLLALARQRAVALHHPLYSATGAHTSIRGDGANTLHVTLAASIKGRAPGIEPLALWAALADRSGGSPTATARIEALQHHWERAAKPLPERFDIQGTIEGGIGTTVAQALRALHTAAAQQPDDPDRAAFLAWCATQRRFAIEGLPAAGPRHVSATILPDAGATYLLLAPATGLSVTDWQWLLLAASRAPGPIVVARTTRWSLVDGDTAWAQRIDALQAQWSGARAVRLPRQFDASTNPHYRTADHDTKVAYVAALDWFRKNAALLDPALLPAASDDRATARKKREQFLLRYHDTFRPGVTEAAFDVNLAREHWKTIYALYPARKK